ncbi:MAG: helix-turn-helix domain-containing protein [Deltaproteobacteria bacterium]|nr:helix-turn-helix domain-containing protein [Deltaproteobacteria bacterium]
MEINSDIDYKAVFERMLEAGKFRNATQVARFLGVSPQAISNYRKRGELPASMVIKFAIRRGVSVDWLLTGKGGAEAGFESSNLSCAIALIKAPADISRLAVLTPEEVVYVGKLLAILRRKESIAAQAVKMNIDAVA